MEGISTAKTVWFRASSTKLCMHENCVIVLPVNTVGLNIPSLPRVILWVFLKSLRPLLLSCVIAVLLQWHTGCLRVVVTNPVAFYFQKTFTE